MENRIWKIMGRRLKYSERELETFKARSENSEIMAKAAVLNNLEIVARVVSSQGCNSGHSVGQEIVLDGAGNFIADKIPARLCAFLTGSLPSFVYGIHELVYAGVEPGKIRLRINRAGCADVGVEHCGWGRVILEVTVRPRVLPPIHVSA